MPDKEKVIKGLKCCLNGPMQCDECPYKNDDGTTVPICVKTLRNEAVELLKEQEEERYADMVLSWLMEIALNNTDAREEMLYIDAVEDIRDRARHGLKQYFIDKQKGQC